MGAETYAAWRCADPVRNTIQPSNEWHTVPEGGPIRASNTAVNICVLDNTACNLASVNLRQF